MRGAWIAGLLLIAAGVAAQGPRPTPDLLPTVTGGEITIAPVTHGTLVIRYRDAVVLIDPARFTPGAPMPFPKPKPGEVPVLPPGLTPRDPISMWPVAGAQLARFEGLPVPTLILVTDEHDDHHDPKAIAALRGPSTQVVGPAVVAARVPGTVTMANGERRTIGGIAIEAVPMYNLRPEPGFTEVFHTKGRGNGYVLTIAGTRIYVAGDTACTPEMQALRGIDVAFLPMNLPYTMSPADAATCARALRPKIVYPYHFFGSDVATFTSALGGSGIEVRVRDWYVGVPQATP